MMNPSRIWVLGAVVAVVAIVAGAVGLGVQPQLAAAATADMSTSQVQAQNETTQMELLRLSKAAASQSKLQAEDTTLSSAVTGSLRLSTFSRQVRDLAELDGVNLISLAPTTPTVYAPLAAAASSSSTSASTTTASTSTSTAAATPGDFGKTEALITPANFTIVPVTIGVTGAEAAVVQFSSDLQHMDRLFAVNNVIYTSSSTSGELPTTTISGNVYALKR